MAPSSAKMPITAAEWKFPRRRQRGFVNGALANVFDEFDDGVIIAQLLESGNSDEGMRGLCSRSLRSLKRRLRAPA